MKDVTLRPVDPGFSHIAKFDVVVDGEVRGRIELSRRDFQSGVGEAGFQAPFSRSPRESTKWEASPVGKDDWWAFRSRKAAIEHVIGGPVGKVTKEASDGS